MTGSHLLVTTSRIKAEMTNIQRLLLGLEERGLLSDSVQRKNKLMDEFILRAVGSVLHDFYTSVENVFKIVARNIDGLLPESNEWHVELLNQMSIAITKVRPVVINKKTRDLLNEFRGFRHIFRNIYGFNLIRERLEHLLELLPQTVEFLETDINHFIEEIGEIITN
mgnify:FL=1|jgi:hypothetical protein